MSIRKHAHMLSQRTSAVMALLLLLIAVGGCTDTPTVDKKEIRADAASLAPSATKIELPTNKNTAVEPPHILVFTKTLGYRHKNIPDAVQALRQMSEGCFVVEQTEDAGAFTLNNLQRFGAVVFLSTTGDVLNDEQQKSFEQYIHSGGGFVGIHAASDTEYNWPWYGDLVGAWFKDHTKVIPATVHRENKTHMSTIDFPDSWKHEDEWYRFQTNPRKNVLVLLNVNDGDLGEVTMNGDHPISWMHEFEGGRAWYTAMGHTKESFQSPEICNHIKGGILWAMNSLQAK